MVADVIITRCTNNYGPRQYPEKLIPKTILLANQEQKNPSLWNTVKTLGIGFMLMITVML